MRRFAARALIAGFVLFVLIGFGHSLWFEHERARFDAVIAQFRDAGEPTQHREIVTRPVPDDQNTFLVVEQAARMVDRLEEEGSFGLNRTYVWDDSDGPAPSAKEHAAIKADFKKLGEFFETLEGIRRRTGWHERDASGIDGIVAMQSVYWYALRRYEFDPGGSPTDQAIWGVDLIWTLQARNEPRDVLGWLMNSTFRRLAAVAAVRMAGHRSVNPSRLWAALAARLRACDEIELPRQVLINERIDFCAWGLVELGRTDGKYFARDRTAWWSRPGSIGRMADILERSEAVIQSASMITTAEAALELAQVWGQDLERETEFKGRVRRSLRSRAEDTAAIRLSRIALALRVEKSKRGVFPGSLDALAPYFPDGVPTDPFTRAPFSYEHIQNGVRLSAGKPGVLEAQLEDEGLLFELQ